MRSRSARVEALGAKAMDGVRANLNDLAEARVRTDAITRARTAEEVPLATAVGLLARERLTGEAPPDAARKGLALVAPWIEEKAGAELDALALTIDDQMSFATLSRRLLEDLELADADEPRTRLRKRAGTRIRATRKGPTRPTMPRATVPPAATWRCARKRPSSDEGEDESADSEADVDEGEATSGQEGADQARANPQRRNWLDEPVTDYKPFTTRFDEIVAAERAVRRGGAQSPARLSRPADVEPWRGRHPARQSPSAAADGAAGAELGFRPGGRDARRGAAGPGHHLARSFAVLQDRARHRVQGHGGQPADRQFGLDARAADLDRRDLRRRARADAGAVRRRDRNSRLHDARLERRAGPGAVAVGRAPAACRAGSTTFATSSTSAPTSPIAMPARASA